MSQLKTPLTQTPNGRAQFGTSATLWKILPRIHAQATRCGIQGIAMFLYSPPYVVIRVSSTAWVLVLPLATVDPTIVVDEQILWRLVLSSAIIRGPRLTSPLVVHVQRFLSQRTMYFGGSGIDCRHQTPRRTVCWVFFDCLTTKSTPKHSYLINANGVVRR